jgi:hypothetical protein
MVRVSDRECSAGASLQHFHNVIAVRRQHATNTYRSKSGPIAIHKCGGQQCIVILILKTAKPSVQEEPDCVCVNGCGSTRDVHCL